MVRRDRYEGPCTRDLGKRVWEGTKGEEEGLSVACLLFVPATC